MIKVYESDTIIDVVNKINSCEEKELLIEFPFGHSILHNYMSLKILKNKSGAKKITILTNDLISKKIGTPLGINYSIVKDIDFHKEKNLKQELLKHNFTFFEYFIFIIKKYFNNFIRYIGNKTGINGLKYYNPYNRVKKTGLFFLVIGFLTSIGMLMFIFYFAVSKTFIEIVPEINIKTKAINIIYEEGKSDLGSISKELIAGITKIFETSSLKYTHKTTGIDYENTSRAKGIVIFINELKEEQIFKPKTRLLNPDGIVFETTDWVKLPGRTITASGETIFGTGKVDIIAKVQDNKGAFVGSKGNIKSSTFTIPGLKFNQDKIYAKLDGETTGGKDDLKYIVGEKDIENAKLVLEEMLRKDVMQRLKSKIENESKLSGVKYEILGIKDIIKYSKINIKTIPENIKVGDKLEKFDLIGDVRIETYIYNKDEVLTLLKNVINDSLLQGTDKLMFIDENSLRMTVVLEKKENPLKIKATTEIDMGISYDFGNNSNYYNQKLKTLILGLSNDEATNILINEDKISSVVIHNTPFFINTVSSNLDNIIMKVIDKQE
ncbi:MAG: hypothetical protein PHE25_03310 [Candidatus Gracilibacteria bacterium]|nr:hypothetical protein [Candidatus Gracilibacteria bacterium]